MSKEATEYEIEFSKLLQQGKKDEAKQHLAGGKADDLAGLTRVAQCRAVVLMEGESEDVETTAMAPKYLRLPADKLTQTLQEVVESYRATGKGEAKKAKKAKMGGVKRKGTRGLKPGAPPPVDDEEELKERDESTSSDEEADEAPPQEVQDEPESSSEDEDAPEPVLTGSINLGAVQELLEQVQLEVSKKLSEVDDKMGEALINVSALTKAFAAKGGQEKRLAEEMERISQKLDRPLEGLYEQQAFMIEALALIGSNVMDCSPDEFHKAVLGVMEERAKERRAQLSKEGAADSGGEKSDDE